MSPLERIPIVVPAQDWGQSPVQIVHWLVEPGETVEAAEILAEVGQPGIVGDLHAGAAGVISELFYSAGATVTADSVLGWITPWETR